MRWDIEFHGGAYDGWGAESEAPLPPVLLVWICEGKRCGGHATRHADSPLINLRTVETYKRGEVNLDDRSAVYEIGDGPGDREDVSERELVGVGADWDEDWRQVAGLGHGWPVSR